MQAQPNFDAPPLKPQPAVARRSAGWWKPWGRTKRPSDEPLLASTPAAAQTQGPARYVNEPMSEDDAFLQRIRRAGL